MEFKWNKFVLVDIIHGNEPQLKIVYSVIVLHSPRVANIPGKVAS
jgi:hypothetical protein